MSLPHVAADLSADDNLSADDYLSADDNLPAPDRKGRPNDVILLLPINGTISHLQLKCDRISGETPFAR